MENRETITVENIDTKLLDSQRGAIRRATEGKFNEGDKELLEGALSLLTEMADIVYFREADKKHHKDITRLTDEA